MVRHTFSLQFFHMPEIRYIRHFLLGEEGQIEERYIFIKLCICFKQDNGLEGT